MRWRTVHKRARRFRPPRSATISMKRVRNRLRKRGRLAAGSIYLPRLEQLRAGLSVPEFRRLYDQQPLMMEQEDTRTWHERTGRAV